jgi:hypothetical protein
VLNAVRSYGYLVLAMGIFISPTSHAFKLAAESSKEEQRLAEIDNDSWWSLLWVEKLLSSGANAVFATPVHEEITNRMYGCNGDKAVCAGHVALTAPPSVLAGVRWNDDPPFPITSVQARGTTCLVKSTVRFELQPRCWAKLFLDSKRKAQQGVRFSSTDIMLARTHFGDLQFMHAMAVADGVRACETKAEIMDWLEFTWRAAQKEFTLETRLKTIQIGTIQARFGMTEWRLLDLFTAGSGSGLRREVANVAFGSLLHTVQDSFAGGHSDREESAGVRNCTAGNVTAKAPGAIRTFHSYIRQDAGLHGVDDDRPAFSRRFQEPGNVVQIGAALVEARDKNMDWNTIKPFFECVFELTNPDALSGSGNYVLDN